MNKIYTKLFDFCEIGDDFPTIIMGVINLSPESFYQGSVYSESSSIELVAKKMINNGAKIIDLGARSTAPWSKKITIEEELNRIIPVMEILCKIIPENIIISLDTQYQQIAQSVHKISLRHKRKMIINDVSCLKTDPNLQDFIIEKEIPIILMASKNIPGDLCTIKEIIQEFDKTINGLKKKGYDEKKIINYSSYIKKIVDSSVIDHIRKMRRERGLILQQKHKTISEWKSTYEIGSIFDKNLKKMVRETVDSLLESRRKVVKLYLLNLSIEEIATLFCWSRDKTRNLLYRGLSDLKKDLKKKDIEYEIK